MLTRRRLLRTLPIAAGALWGCDQKTPPSRYRLPKKPLIVVTSTVHAADLLRAVGGEAVKVTSLIPPQANPHLWQPIAADYGLLQLADAFFLSGLGLESRFTADLEVLRGRGLPVGVLANGLTDDDVLTRPDGSSDPHFWMDPRLWAKAAYEAGSVLSTVYPKAARWFEDRAHEYADSLDQLHRYATREFSDVPERARVLFSSHDSMAYFGTAYQLRTRSFANSAGQAPAQTSPELLAWLHENAVKTLFREHFVEASTMRDLTRPLNLFSESEIFSLSLAAPGTVVVGIASELAVSSCLPALRFTVDTIKGRLALA